MPVLFGFLFMEASVVAVAQLVESRIVIPVVVGSSPISHPTLAPFRALRPIVIVFVAPSAAHAAVRPVQGEISRVNV